MWVAFTFYITTNFPCGKHFLGSLYWSAEWLNLGWIFAPLAEYLQGLFSLPSEGLFEPSAKYIRGNVTFSSVHSSDLDFKIFIPYFFKIQIPRFSLFVIYLTSSILLPFLIYPTPTPINPGINRKPDNTLKGVRNLAPNRTQNQWPHGLAVPTWIEH